MFDDRRASSDSCAEPKLATARSVAIRSLHLNSRSSLTRGIPHINLIEFHCFLSLCSAIIYINTLTSKSVYINKSIIQTALALLIGFRRLQRNVLLYSV